MEQRRREGRLAPIDLTFRHFFLEVTRRVYLHFLELDEEDASIGFEGLIRRTLESVGGKHGLDLYVASACAMNVPGAWEELDRRLKRWVPKMLKDSGVRSADLEEAQAETMKRLVVPRRSGRSGLGDYYAGGRLFWFVAFVARGAAADLAKQRERQLRAEPLGVELTGPLASDGEKRRLAEAADRRSDDVWSSFLGVIRRALGKSSGKEKRAFRAIWRDARKRKDLAASMGRSPSSVSHLLRNVYDRIFADMPADLLADIQGLLDSGDIRRFNLDELWET